MNGEKTDLYNLSLIEHHNTVSIPDSTQSVSYHQDCSILAYSAQCLRDDALAG